MLKTYKRQYQPNLNNQVIIHTEINNYKPLKEYVINLNNMKNNYKNKYIRNLSPENLIIPLTKSNRNQKKYIYLENELNNNSFSNVNYPSKKIIPSQVINQIKPYQKKSVFFKPNKSKEKYNHKLNFAFNSGTIKTNCITERSFDNSKISFIKDEDDFSFMNINENRENIYLKNNDNKTILKNKPINKCFTNNDKKICRKIPLSKKYVPTKNLKFLSNKIKEDIIQNNIIDNRYHQRLTKILILLIEKYFKTYLFKNKYIFLNNLKSYARTKIKSIKNKKSKIRNLFNIINITDRRIENKTKTNYLCNIKYKKRNENNILIQKLKNENVKKIVDKLNFSELFRNKSELFKKEITINRRKGSKYKSKSNEKCENIIFNRIQNYNIIKKNKSIDNIHKSKKINLFYNKIQPMLIVKKIKTKDNRIHIDIKYLEQINTNFKKPFKKLKVTRNNSFSIIIQRNNFFKFDKIYYKIKDQNNYTFRKEKKLSCIQEEEI